LTFSDDPQNAKLWLEKLTIPNKPIPGIKLFLKSGGSQFSKNQPFIRSESYFNQKYKMEKLVKCIHKPIHSAKWDKLIANTEKFEFVPGVKCCEVSYICQKSQYSICARDFYEKGINFYHNGKFYRYSSSVENADKPGPNGEPALKPIPNTSTVRATTLINC